MSYEDDASSRVKNNNPLTPKPDNSWMKSLPEVDAMPRFRPAPQPPPEAALCGAHCPHPASSLVNGVCRNITFSSMGDQDSHTICGHRCTFPAPEAPLPPLTPDEAAIQVCRALESLNALPTPAEPEVAKARVLLRGIIGCGIEAPAVAETPSNRTISNQFHKVWTSQVGTEGYNKKDWQELRRLLDLRGIRV